MHHHVYRGLYDLDPKFTKLCHDENIDLTDPNAYAIFLLFFKAGEEAAIDWVNSALCEDLLSGEIKKT